MKIATGCNLRLGSVAATFTKALAYLLPFYKGNRAGMKGKTKNKKSSWLGSVRLKLKDQVEPRLKARLGYSQKKLNLEKFESSLSLDFWLASQLGSTHWQPYYRMMVILEHVRNSWGLYISFTSMEKARSFHILGFKRSEMIGFWHITYLYHIRCSKAIPQVRKNAK